MGTAALIVRSLQAITQWTCSPSQLFLATCPTRAGGLGIRDPLIELPGAVIASQLAYLVQEADAPVSSFLSSPQLGKAVRYIEQQWDLSLPVLASWGEVPAHSLSSRVPEEACKERFWSSPIVDQLLVKWQATAPARLQAIRAACQGHVDVFEARPPVDEGQVLTSGQWRLFLQYRLAIPLCAGDIMCCRGCGSPVDTWGDHALMCSRLGMYSRHNHLRDTLATLLRSYGFSAQLEASPTSTQERPADVLVCGILDTPDAVDLSYVHVLHPTTSMAGLDTAQIIAQRESEKRRQNTAGCQLMRWRCVPFVTSTMGQWGAAAKRFMGRVIKLRALHTGLSSGEVARDTWGVLTQATIYLPWRGSWSVPSRSPPLWSPLLGALRTLIHCPGLLRSCETWPRPLSRLPKMTRRRASAFARGWLLLLMSHLVPTAWL